MKQLSLGKKLKRIRERREPEMSQDRVATAAKISLKTYNTIECGRGDPRMLTLMAILKKLDACICEVFPPLKACSNHKLLRKKKVQKSRRAR